MHQKLRDLKEREIEGLQVYCDDEIDNLRAQFEDRLSGVRQQYDIHNKGWQAYEDGGCLGRNPYSFLDYPDEYNWWKAGWEMAQGTIREDMGDEYSKYGG